MTADRIAGSETVSILRAIYPSFRILDMSFPALNFFWLYDETAVVLNKESVASPAELDFFRRFRQCGGHEPLLQLTDLAHSVKESEDRPPKTTLLTCDASDDTIIAEVLLRPRADTGILVYGDKNLVLFEQIGFHAWLSFRFVRPKWSETVQLLSLNEPAPDTIAHIVSAAQSFAVDIRVKPQPKATPGSLITITLPAEGFRPVFASFTPNRLIHDGSRRSEGNAKYSWLWVGAEHHIRCLFGKVPDHFRTVRVVVLNAHSTANLQSAKLLLNGIVVPTQVEIWDEGAGAVSTNLFAGTQVIGFSVSTVTRLDDGTKLAACIERIEFHA